MAETQDDSIRFTVALTEPEPEPEPPEPEPEPPRTKWVIVAAALVGAYLLLRKRS